MNWQQICRHPPPLKDLPFKLETDRWGRIIMSPATNRHSRLQSLIARLLDRAFPGPHIRDRYLVSVEGWRLLVWRIADHYGEYEGQLHDRTLGDRIAAERRAQYEPFVRMDLYENN